MLRSGCVLFAIVSLTAVGSIRVYQPQSDLQKPAAGLCVPAHDAIPRSVSSVAQSRNNSTHFTNGFPAKGESQARLFYPIQYKDPKNLGIGKLLVASRGLGDPRFAETVVLLVRYDQEGVLGLVLNRRTTVPLSQILDLEAAKKRSDPIYLGGPMEPASAFALLQSRAKVERADNVFDGVYLITEKSLFEKTLLAQPDPGVFHVYMGYAGWTQNQLQAEVRLGAWFVFPADAATVFNSDPDSLWLQMIHRTNLQLAQTSPLTPTFRQLFSF
jgi:putative AlgH/UPF0301 family transcriptional regulator